MKLSGVFGLIAMIATAHIGLPMFQHWCNTRMEKHVFFLPLSCSGNFETVPAGKASCCATKAVSGCGEPASSDDKSCCDESVFWLADDSERLLAESHATPIVPDDSAILFRGYPYSLKQHFLFRDLDIYFLRPPPPFKHSRSYLSVYLC